jgi:hypothetical protein
MLFWFFLALEIWKFLVPSFLIKKRKRKSRNGNPKGGGEKDVGYRFRAHEGKEQRKSSVIRYL